MPLYEFKCDNCGAEREIILPFSESGKKLECDCGRVMRRKFSLVHFTMPLTGKDKVLSALNMKGEGYGLPTDLTDRPRYEQAMAKGLDQTRPVIGRGL